MKHRKKVIIIFSVLLAVIIGCDIYVSDYYPANEQALQALISDEAVTVSKLADGIQEQYCINLPTDTIEEVIEGGCHAYFGSYGEQEGDGIAAMTPEEQQRITIEAITDMIDEYNE